MTIGRSKEGCAAYLLRLNLRPGNNASGQIGDHAAEARLLREGRHTAAKQHCNQNCDKSMGTLHHGAKYLTETSLLKESQKPASRG
jgi:hypothetical protein